MKLATLVLSTSLLLVLWPQAAMIQAQQKPEDLAQKSAEAWLALTDSAKYAESWDEASSVFKNALTKEQWIGALKAVRSPLGAVQSRRLKEATYTKSLPGAPDGEYVVLKFDTNFENKKSSIETVTPMLDKDGKWRVSGYFITGQQSVIK
jgi:hypothetical protein